MFGRVEITSAVLGLLLRRGIDLVLLSQRGVYRGRLVGRAARNTPLRLAQYHFSTSPSACLPVARALIAGKIRHQRQILLRANRRLRDERLASAIGTLRMAIHRVMVADNLDTIRGLEGNAAAVYFANFPQLIINDQFSFSGRNRRPPRDPVNALLSFGYAVVGSLLESDVYRCGLDPLLGVFHQPAYGRASLSLDLLEEFRPLVDTLVLKVINRRQLSPADFEQLTGETVVEILQDEDVIHAGMATHLDVRGPQHDEEPTPGVTNPVMGVYLGEMGRRVFLNELFRRLRESQHYPRRGVKLEMRDIFREQLYHLARVIEGTDAEYTPFVPD